MSVETKATLAPEATVNQIVVAWPATLPVFRSYGIDTCCGGALPVAEVARRHGLDLPAVLAALRAAAGGAEEGA